MQSNACFQVLMHNEWFKDTFGALKAMFQNLKFVRPILHGEEIAFLKLLNLIAESMPSDARIFPGTFEKSCTFTKTDS